MNSSSAFAAGKELKSGYIWGAFETMNKPSYQSLSFVLHGPSALAAPQYAKSSWCLLHPDIKIKCTVLIMERLGSAYCVHFSSSIHNVICFPVSLRTRSSSLETLIDHSYFKLGTFRRVQLVIIMCSQVHSDL